MLVKPFVFPRSRCRFMRGLRKVPIFGIKPTVLQATPPTLTDSVVELVSLAVLWVLFFLLELKNKAALSSPGKTVLMC